VDAAQRSEGVNQGWKSEVLDAARTSDKGVDAARTSNESVCSSEKRGEMSDEGGRGLEERGGWM